MEDLSWSHPVGGVWYPGGGGVLLVLCVVDQRSRLTSRQVCCLIELYVVEGDTNV